MPVDRSRLPTVGSDPRFRFPAIAQHRLANGLEVRTVEHPGVPVVTFALLVEGGSGGDAAGQEGLAALVADMLDEGTGELDAIGVSDAMARIGADYDVEVSPDVTVFSLTTLVRFADRGAALLAALAARPSLRETDADRVRQLRLDRLRQLKDHPPAVAEREFLRLLYGTHPYGHLSIGSEDSLRTLTIDDIRHAHARTVRPATSVLVVVGAMRTETLRDCADRAFGAWDGAVSLGPAAATAASDAPASTSAARVTIVPRPGAAQSELRIGHLSRARRDSPDYPALIVLNAALGGQFVSRVNMKLREEKAYTYGARTSFDWRRRGSLFALQASVHSGSTADAIADSLGELEGVRGARPLSSRELELAKASLTRGYPRNFETAQQVARSVAQLAAFGLPDDYFERFTPRAQAVTEADVARVATEYLHPGELTTLVVGDAEAIADSIRALGLTPMDVRG
jgi:zinc protease